MDANLKESSESIIGIIPNTTRKKGLFSNQCINVIITDKRIILAHLTSEVIKEEAERVSKASKEKGKNIFSRMAQYAFCGQSAYKKYFNMAPDEILAENKENFEINPENIIHAKIDSNKIYKNNIETAINVLKIKHTSGNLELNFDDNKSISAREARAIFSHAFSNKIE
ncbi:MAG: hypothetical protein V1859_08385 [archaeon]